MFFGLFRGLRREASALYHLIRFRSIYRRQFAALRRVAGTKRGRNALLLANGPSVNLLDPGKLRLLQAGGADLFVLNDFACSSLFDQVIPDYYILTDPLNFFDTRAYASKEEVAGILERAEIVAERLRKTRCTVCVPYHRCAQARTIFGTERVLPMADGSSFVFGTVRSPLLPRRYIDRTSYKALILAGYLGYDRIFIAGFDCDAIQTMRVDRKNQIAFRYRYFWTPAEQAPTYHNTRGKWTHKRVSYWYKNAHEEHYWLERIAAALPNVVNLDPNSLVDAFPKEHSLDVYRSA
jgi:hypothetical protein